MIILLVMILAIALCFIIAGLFLSPRASGPPSRGVSYTARSGSGVRRSSQYAPIRRASQVTARTRRPYQEVEQEPWAGFAGYLNAGRIFRSYPADKSSWVGLTLILVAVFCFSLFTLKTFLPSSGIVATAWPDAAAAATPPVANANANNAKASPFASLSGASKALVRINQLDPVQYNSQQDYNTWAYSACSTAAMTAVINSYGHNYRLADILKVEAGIHEITPDLGLLEPTGIDRTVAQFGFKTYWLSNTSLDNVIKVANQGHPVIVGFPPALWSGGHLLVVRGGTSQYVYLADSSRLNMQTMARATFMKYWAGFAVVAMPA